MRRVTLYLSTYHGVDAFDHMIQNVNCMYVSWKYWHSPMLHAFSMAVVTAYDFYCEVVSGKKENETWEQYYNRDMSGVDLH